MQANIQALTTRLPRTMQCLRLHAPQLFTVAAMDDNGKIQQLTLLSGYVRLLGRHLTFARRGTSPSLMCRSAFVASGRHLHRLVQCLLWVCVSLAVPCD